jgi:hypothetical protein
MLAIEARHAPLPFSECRCARESSPLAPAGERQQGEPVRESTHVPGRTKAACSASEGNSLSQQATENSAALGKSGTLARVAFRLLPGPALKRSAYVSFTPFTASAQAPTLAALRLLRASLASSQRMLLPWQAPKAPSFMRFSSQQPNPSIERTRLRPAAHVNR